MEGSCGLAAGTGAAARRTAHGARSTEPVGQAWDHACRARRGAGSQVVARGGVGWGGVRRSGAAKSQSIGIGFLVGSTLSTLHLCSVNPSVRDIPTLASA